MKKRLSLKVLGPLILFTLIPGVIFTGLAEWLTEGLLIDHFLQRAIALGQHINQEFYDRYFNPWYAVEKEAFNPLDPKHLKELDELIHDNMRHFQVERVNFFSPTGQVIYSTEKGLVGMDASVIPQVRQALRGQVTSKVVYGFRPDRLHGKAGTLLNHDVIEIYLPMLCLNEKLPNHGQQVGVLELYQNINVVRQWLTKIRLYMGGVLSLILVVSIVGASSSLHLAALKPIRQMVDTITAPDIVVDGKLMKRIDGGSTYELRGLADSFNRMVEDVIEKTRQLNEAKEMAMVDELTSLYNHRYFHRRLEEELSRAARAQTEVSLIFCDLDGFKGLNDSKGHQAGDLGLKEISRILQGSKRVSDVACRYGGDEFALILPGATSDAAKILAERLRARVEDRFQGNPDEWGEGLTLSIGIASYPKDAPEKKTLIERADWAMYYAKRNGKNWVKVFDLSEFVNLPFVDSQGREERLESMRALVGALRGEDGYLQRHSETVASQAAAVARQMGMDPLEVDRVLVAGLLHDIGVIVLPDQIMSKAEKLTEEEMDQVKQHPVVAVNLLDSVEGFKEVLPIILHHHEQYAGGGYPQGLAHQQIPMGARILAVVDAYYAMRSARPFRRAFTREEVIEELRRCSGTQFDPDVVENFIQWLSMTEKTESEEEAEKEVVGG
ncbi:MAG: diguanylate cyclase [Nitrospinae bacterium]|nr:diguanylate cyclase [Nitrospinota bacterium]